MWLVVVVVVVVLVVVGDGMRAWVRLLRRTRTPCTHAPVTPAGIQPLVQQAVAALEANWRERNTIPSPKLYPHQVCGACTTRAVSRPATALAVAGAPLIGGHQQS